MHKKRFSQTSLRETCRSVGQNRQISEMSGEFFSLPESMSDERLESREMPREYLGSTWYENVIRIGQYFLCILLSLNVTQSSKIRLN